jgi:hypothetical protein
VPHQITPTKRFAMLGSPLQVEPSHWFHRALTSIGKTKIDQLLFAEIV